MPHFQTELTVRTYECDLYGHVHNATFLNYLEYARIELLKKMGFTLNDLMRAGFLLPIVKIEIAYKKPAFPGDELIVTVSWINRGKTSAVFHQQILNKINGQLVTDAKVTWVTTNLKGRPMAIPTELIESYKRSFNSIP